MRPGSLALEQRRIMRREPKARGATVAFNRVEDSVGIEGLEQNERSAEPNIGQQADESAHVCHRQGHEHDVVVRKCPMLDNQVCRLG